MSEARMTSISAQAPKRTRKSKFNNDEERHQSILASKRRYYQRNIEMSKLSSLKCYYVKKLKRDDLNEDVKNRYQQKLNEINLKLNSSKN